MIRLATILALTPLAALAHPTDVPHVHSEDPSLWIGLAMIAVFTTLGILVKRRRV